MSVLALVPARTGSKSIPHKNFRKLGGKYLYEHALNCAKAAGCDPIILSTNAYGEWLQGEGYTVLPRPNELAQDDTPMLAVVQHALAAIPGPPEQIICLLQPTQPFRTPEHVKAAIALLESSGADSVVSVVELPLTQSYQSVLAVTCNGFLVPAAWMLDSYNPPSWADSWALRPARRQDAEPTYIPDGTCYAFRRATVEKYGSIFGEYVRPLIVPPAQSCELDTMADWEAVQARWASREG